MVPWWLNNPNNTEQGERIQDGHRFHTRYNTKVQEQRPFKTEYAFDGNLYFCAENEAPSRCTPGMPHKNLLGSRIFSYRLLIGIKEFCSVDWRIERVKLLNEPIFTDYHDKQTYRTATFDLHVVFDSATIRYVIAYKGETVAFTEAKYREYECS